MYSLSYEICTRLCCALFWCDKLASKRFECNFRNMILKLILVIDGWCISFIKLLSSNRYLTLLMTSQQRFKWWLGAKKAASRITWTNVEPVLCRHMASPGHNYFRNIDSIINIHLKARNILHGIRGISSLFMVWTPGSMGARVPTSSMVEPPISDRFFVIVIPPQ